MSTGLISLRRLAQQPLRTLVAVVAVAAGVALLAGVTIARSSVGHSLSGFTSAISGDATLKVIGAADHGGLPDDVLAPLRAVPGVGSAVPLVMARAAATDRHGDERYVTALGVDCSVEVIVGSFGCDQTSFANAPVVIPARLADELGPDGVLRTDGGPVPIATALVLPALDGINGGSMAIWPITRAQELFSREGRLDAVLIVPESGADPGDLKAGLVAAAGPSNQVVAADHAELGFLDLLFVGLGLASLLGLLVGGQLVRNTLLLSFEERRAELALLGAVGATPGRVARGIVAEAALLGLAGGVVGAGLGVAVAGRFVTALSDTAERTSGLHLDLHVSAVAALLAAAFGVGAELLGAIEPARRATRLDLAGELAGRGGEANPVRTRRWATPLLGTGAGVGLTLALAGRAGGSIEPWQPAAALLGLGLGMTCLFRLPGRVAPGLIAVIHRRTSNLSGSWRLAVGNLAGDPARIRAVATTLAIAVTFAVTLGALSPAIEAAGRADAQLAGEVVTVTAVPLNNGSGIDAKLTASDLATIEAIDGVADSHGHYHAQVAHPLVGYLFVGATDGLVPDYSIHRGADPVSVLDRGDVLIGPAFARNRSLRPGDRFSFPGVNGVAELTVGAIWAAPDGVGRSLYLPLEQFEELLGPRPPTHVALTPTEGVSSTELARRVEGAGLGAHIMVFGPDQLAHELGREYASFTEPFRALEVGLLAVAFTATASTLVLAGVQRRREHALLGALGLSPRGMGWMTVVEVLVITGVAIALGAAAGLAGAYLFALSSGVVTGATFDPPLSLASVPRVGATVVAVALVAALLPALRTSRVNPALALRHT